MERLEDAIRSGDDPAGLILLLRGGEDTRAKLLKQAALLESRFTLGSRPVRGISLFAAADDLDERRVLAAKLSTYPRYRRVPAAAIGELCQLVPTFQAPHWSAIFPPFPNTEAEELFIEKVLASLGPVRENPKYERRTRRR